MTPTKDNACAVVSESILKRLAALEETFGKPFYVRPKTVDGRLKLFYLQDLDSDDSWYNLPLADFGEYDPFLPAVAWKWNLATMIATLINSARDLGERK